jgi:hypothetical protein
MKKISMFILLSYLFALPGLYAQPDILQEDLLQDDPLIKSLSLITNTISLVQNIQADNELLKNNNESLELALTNVLDMLKMQGASLIAQAKTQAEQSAISSRQANLLGKELKKGKILKWSLIIAAPLCTGLGIWAGMKLAK